MGRVNLFSLVRRLRKAGPHEAPCETQCSPTVDVGSSGGFGVLLVGEGLAHRR